MNDDARSVRPHVGTLNERAMHAALKQALAEPGDRFESAVDGYVVDIVRGSTLIEIQTGNFSALRAKLASLVPNHEVRLVHPIAATKWIVKAPSPDRPGGRRRSPKRGVAADLFAELVSFPSLIEHPSFEIEVVLVEAEEHQRFDGDKGWRRRGWVVEERHLVEIVERQRFRNSADLASLLPNDLPFTFTTADLARRLGRPRRLGQQMAYCLKAVNVIRAVGRTKDGVTYRVASGV